MGHGTPVTLQQGVKLLESQGVSEIIAVPLFLSSGGREHAIAARLEGLDFKWTGETLLPHPLLTEFLKNSVEQAEKNIAEVK